MQVKLFVENLGAIDVTEWTLDDLKKVCEDFYGNGASFHLKVIQ